MMENWCDEPCVVLQKVKEAVEELVLCHVSELETTLKFVVPAVVETMQQIYTRNDLIVKSNEDDALHLIRENFQVALSLMDSSNDILQHLIQTGVIPLSYIPSLPVNIAHILFSTFSHCKNSQKIYCTYYKSVAEILDLFRKTQEVHSRYLTFLESHLTVDFFDENDIVVYKQILDVLSKISSTLTGVNMKSMVDNWKGFISLIQKSSKQNISVSISPAIQILTAEINENLLIVFDKPLLDSKKCSQDLKVTAFLIKVALKLLEIDYITSEDYEDVFKFWITIFSLHNRFYQCSKLPNEVEDSINVMFQLCSDSLPDLLCGNTRLLKNFLTVYRQFESLDTKYGVLMFIITVLKEVPKVVIAEPELCEDFNIISVLQIIIDLSKSCYMEYFSDKNSTFYEDLVTYMAVIILHFPEKFSNVEKMFIDCIIEEDIWTALIAIDTWCLVLKYSTVYVCHSTLTVLIKKMEDLKLGVFHQTPAIIRLKILTQRILKIVPTNISNDEIAKYNTTSHLHVWKILNFRNIPLSHRYYVEFLMCDVFDKIENLEDCSVIDLVHWMESLDIISYTKFNNLEISPIRLTKSIVQLWSFDVSDVSLNNAFLQYFVFKLMKITTSLILELDNKNVLLVFNQLKTLVHHSCSKLLLCAILQAMSRRNFNNFLEKQALFTVITGLFQMLLADKNSIVIQLALESFNKLSISNNYEHVVRQVSNSSLENKKNISYYTQKCASKVKYDAKYFEKIRSFKYRHRCYEWSSADQPLYKKIRVDNNTDLIIDRLKMDTEKLLNTTNKGELTANQRIDVKSVISHLEELLK